MIFAPSSVVSDERVRRTVPANQDGVKAIVDSELGSESQAEDLYSHTVTHLLRRWSQGEREAAEQMLPLVYDKLRSIARKYLRKERRDHTLQPTALVHDVYLELMELSRVRCENRMHFYGLAACLMRRALVDYSRERVAEKRGGHRERVPLEEAESVPQVRPQDLIALDDALEHLARLDPLKALIVELRFFGGMTVDQTAECLELSPRSVAREWQRARLVLFRELAPDHQHAL